MMFGRSTGVQRRHEERWWCTMLLSINELSKYVDLSRSVTWKLNIAQLEAIVNRDFTLARQLGVSTDDYLRVIGCRNI